MNSRTMIDAFSASSYAERSKWSYHSEKEFSDREKPLLLGVVCEHRRFSRL
jgi:hypothetical protein